jgi:hypothetical protein
MTSDVVFIFLFLFRYASGPQEPCIVVGFLTVAKGGFHGIVDRLSKDGMFYHQDRERER